MNMRMNLTGLADLANAQLASKGQPLMLALDDILPDPENPRDFDPGSSASALAEQEQLDEDVAARGVKTPISVRAHPTVPRKYLINYGHRRYRSACANKLHAIPAFVDEKFDSYDQVNENELRTGLTTRARALFIKSRLDAGDSKGEIAERMRKKNQTFITEHLALIDAPDCVNQAYAAGVTSARTLYDLRQAWEEFPVEVDAWCRSSAAINRDGIREALVGFRHDEATTAGGKSEVTADSRLPVFRHDETSLAVKQDVESTGSPSTDFRHDEKKLPGPAEVALERLSEPTAQQTLGRNDDHATIVGKVDRAHTGEAQRPSSNTGAGRPIEKGAAVAGVAVQYKSESARVVQDVVVPIVLDRSGETLHVRLSELIFGC